MDERDPPGNFNLNSKLEALKKKGNRSSITWSNQSMHDVEEQQQQSDITPRRKPTGPSGRTSVIEQRPPANRTISRRSPPQNVASARRSLPLNGSMIGSRINGGMGQCPLGPDLELLRQFKARETEYSQARLPAYAPFRFIPRTDTHETVEEEHNPSPHPTNSFRESTKMNKLQATKYAEDLSKNYKKWHSEMLLKLEAKKAESKRKGNKGMNELNNTGTPREQQRGKEKGDKKKDATVSSPHRLPQPATGGGGGAPVGSVSSSTSTSNAAPSTLGASSSSSVHGGGGGAAAGGGHLAGDSFHQGVVGQPSSSSTHKTRESKLGSTSSVSNNNNPHKQRRSNSSGRDKGKEKADSPRHPGGAPTDLDKLDKEDNQEDRERLIFRKNTNATDTLYDNVESPLGFLQPLPNATTSSSTTSSTSAQAQAGSTRGSSASGTSQSTGMGSISKAVSIFGSKGRGKKKNKPIAIYGDDSIFSPPSPASSSPGSSALGFAVANGNGQPTRTSSYENANSLQSHNSSAGPGEGGGGGGKGKEKSKDKDKDKDKLKRQTGKDKDTMRLHNITDSENVGGGRRGNEASDKEMKIGKG